MHIPDGVLPGGVLIVSGALAAGAVAVGLKKTDTESIPRVGVLSAVFFVASLMRVPLPTSSVHLLLPGLMGLLLGWRVFPALAVALLLQAVQFGHGGILSLGANVLVMGVPGVVCYYAFGGGGSGGRRFARGFAAGAVGIVLSCVMYGLVLLTAGKEFAGVTATVVVAHVPVMVIEGFVTGWALAFISEVHPELLTGGQMRGARR